MNSVILDRKDHRSVIQFLKQLQDTIMRLSSHAMQCKIWTVGLVCAIITLSKKFGTTETNVFLELLSCMVPIIMFLCLNAFYRGLVLQVNSYIDEFTMCLNDYNDISFELKIYQDPISGGLKYKYFFNAFFSRSILLFYLCFCGLIVIMIYV